MIEGAAAEVQTYEQFVSQCARAGPPPEMMATTPAIPELNQLGTAAAPAAAGAGAFSTSGLVFAGYLGGLATSATLSATRPDRPASP